MYLMDTGAAALPRGLAGQTIPVLPSLPEVDGEESDPLALARGLGIALIISVVLWAMLVGAVFWLLRLSSIA